MTAEYRKTLNGSYKLLKDYQHVLMEQIVNLGMTGDLKEIADTFEVGEMMALNIDYFKNSKDHNLEAMVQLFDHLEKTIATLAHLNSIDKK